MDNSCFRIKYYAQIMETLRVDIKFLGHGIKKIVEWGNKRNDNSKRTRQDSKSLLEDEEKEV